MDNKSKLLEFLKSQKFLVVGTQGDEPWIVNVYHGIGDDFKIYFVSSEDSEHSKHILQNPTVTFSTVWHDSANRKNRKGIQGRGKCVIAENNDIDVGINLHNTNFPEFKDVLSTGYIRSEDNKSRVWIIKPSRIKFWNDELYGEDGSEEFNF